MTIPKAGFAKGGRKKAFLDIPLNPKLKSTRCLDEKHESEFRGGLK